jgi:hypothetical protein
MRRTKLAALLSIMLTQTPAYTGVLIGTAGIGLLSSGVVIAAELSDSEEAMKEQLIIDVTTGIYSANIVYQAVLETDGNYANLKDNNLSSQENLAEGFNTFLNSIITVVNTKLDVANAYLWEALLEGIVAENQALKLEITSKPTLSYIYLKDQIKIMQSVEEKFDSIENSNEKIYGPVEESFRSTLSITLKNFINYLENSHEEIANEYGSDGEDIDMLLTQLAENDKVIKDLEKKLLDLHLKPATGIDTNKIFMDYIEAVQDLLMDHYNIGDRVGWLSILREWNQDHMEQSYSETIQVSDYLDEILLILEANKTTISNQTDTDNEAINRLLKEILLDFVDRSIAVITTNKNLYSPTIAYIDMVSINTDLTAAGVTLHEESETLLLNKELFLTEGSDAILIAHITDYIESFEQSVLDKYKGDKKIDILNQLFNLKKDIQRTTGDTIHGFIGHLSLVIDSHYSAFYGMAPDSSAPELFTLYIDHIKSVFNVLSQDLNFSLGLYNANDTQSNNHAIPDKLQTDGLSLVSSVTEVIYSKNQFLSNKDSFIELVALLTNYIDSSKSEFVSNYIGDNKSDWVTLFDQFSYRLSSEPLDLNVHQSLNVLIDIIDEYEDKIDDIVASSENDATKESKATLLYIFAKLKNLLADAKGLYLSTDELGLTDSLFSQEGSHIDSSQQCEINVASDTMSMMTSCFYHNGKMHNFYARYISDYVNPFAPIYFDVLRHEANDLTFDGGFMQPNYYKLKGESSALFDSSCAARLTSSGYFITPCVNLNNNQYSIKWGVEEITSGQYRLRLIEMVKIGLSTFVADQ